MTQIETKLQKWGNSYGIVIPVDVVIDNKMKTGEEVTALLLAKKNNGLKRLFGAHKFSKPIDKILEESDKELYNE